MGEIILTEEEAKKLEVIERSEKECPLCGNKLVPESGCFTCYHCGYSRCS